MIGAHGENNVTFECIASCSIPMLSERSQCRNPITSAQVPGSWSIFITGLGRRGQVCEEKQWHCLIYLILANQAFPGPKP